MKVNGTIYLIAIVALVSIFGSCIPPIAQDGEGSLLIVPGNQSGRNLYQWTDIVASYSASGTGPGTQTFSRDWNTGESCQVDSLRAGLWTITVFGKDSEGSQVTTGQTSATVMANQNTNATVTLGYIPGTGSVSFEVSWPESIATASVECVVEENGVIPRTLSFVISGQTAAASLSAVSAGDHHQFDLALRKADTAILYAITGTIHVTNDKNTPVVIALGEADINNPPQPPSSFTAASGPFCVDLSWTYADAVMGFSIERKKASDSTYQLIAEISGDARSYRDISVVKTQGYDYRIAAFRASGESQPATTSVTTEDFRVYLQKRRVTFGENAMLRIEQDGSVKGFGANNYGEMGSSSKIVSFSGVTVPGVSDIAALCSSTDFTSILALKGDGTAWEWSYNNSPRQVSGIQRQLVSVSRGLDFSLALDADGFIWAWGGNGHGQIGDGTKTTPQVPYRIQGLPRMISVSAGNEYSLAASADGSVYAWGYNLYGQLGFGDTTERLVPTLVPGITQAKSVWCTNTLNSFASFIVMNNGKVYAAGDNRSGQLGLGSTQYKTFTEVFLSSSIIQIQCGSDYTFFLSDTGRISSAGKNTYGVLQGYSSLTDVKEIFSQAYHAIARLNSGSGDTWYGWGLHQFAEFGNGDASISPVPVPHPAPAIFTSMSSYEGTSLAIDSSGDVWAWGDNTYGQVGDGSKVARATPVKVLDESVPVIQVDTDNEASAAVLSDGRIALWGNTTITSPVIQTDPAMTDVRQIAVGYGFRIILKNDGTVWSWGSNSLGQLGDGTTTTRYAPVQVHGVGNTGFLADVVSVDAGRDHATAILQDGRFVAWGDGYRGQLGINISGSNYPIEIPAFANCAGARVSSITNIVLKSDGFWICGGWMGVIRTTPLLWISLSGFGTKSVESFEMSAGCSDNIIALLSDGTVRTMGENFNCQLGDGTTGHTTSSWITPSAPVGVALVAVGSALMSPIVRSGWMSAYDTAGTVWCWGDDSFGQFGDGTINGCYTTAPVLLPW